MKNSQVLNSSYEIEFINYKTIIFNDKYTRIIVSDVTYDSSYLFNEPELPKLLLLYKNLFFRHLLLHADENFNFNEIDHKILNELNIWIWNKK